MKKLLLITSLFFAFNCFAQTDSTQLLRAFPITNYIVELNDSTKLVQVNLKDDKLFKKDQMGILRGLYANLPADTATKGYGRCHLIKGDYYYFAIKMKDKNAAPKEGDLLYSFVDKKNIYYGNIPKIATHFIKLTDVYEKPFYEPEAVLQVWTTEEENLLIAAFVKDIQLTGDYFMKNDPSLNIDIAKGMFKGKKTLNVMIECTPQNVQDFLSYMVARPLIYAGHQWKMSEIFATWASEGAPTVVNN